MSKRSGGVEAVSGIGGGGQPAGVGRLTRRNVLLLGSGTVKRSVGNGPRAGELRSNRASTPAASTADGSRTSRASVRGTKRRNDVIGVSSGEWSALLGRSQSKSAEGIARVAARCQTAARRV